MYQALRMILQLGVKPSWFECSNNLLLPQALRHFLDMSTSISSQKISQSSLHPDSDQSYILNRVASSSRERSAAGKFTKNAAVVF
jgi:hypothetical protein